MGHSNKETEEFVGDYFRFLQRNQIDLIKQTLKQLKASQEYSSVHVVNSIKLAKSGDTSLHICARNGYLKILQYELLEQKISALIP